MDDLNLYDDLDEFQEQQEKKSKELQEVEDKYQESLKTIEELKEDIKKLKKNIQGLELGFQSLLDTARSEIKRKDKEIERLRKEKDDICFRRHKHNYSDNLNENQPSSRYTSNYNPFRHVDAKSNEISSKETAAIEASNLRRNETTISNKRVRNGDERNYSKEYNNVQDKNDVSRDHDEKYIRRTHENVKTYQRNLDDHEENKNNKKENQVHSSKLSYDKNRIRERDEHEKKNSKNTHEKSSISSFDRYSKSSYRSRSRERDKYDKYKNRRTQHESIPTHSKSRSKSPTHRKILYTDSNRDRHKNKRIYINSEKTEKISNKELRGEEKFINLTSEKPQKWNLKKTTNERPSTETVEINATNKQAQSDKADNTTIEKTQKSGKELEVNDQLEITAVNTNQSAMMGISKLCTPRKVALFDEIFGKSPSESCSTSANSLLHNIKGILATASLLEVSSSATTSPADYTDVNSCMSTPSNNTIEILSSASNTPGGVTNATNDQPTNTNEIDKCFIPNKKLDENIDTTACVDLANTVDDDIANEIDFIKIPGLDLCFTKRKTNESQIEENCELSINDISKQKTNDITIRKKLSNKVTTTDDNKSIDIMTVINCDTVNKTPSTLTTYSPTNYNKDIAEKLNDENKIETKQSKYEDKIQLLNSKEQTSKMKADVGTLENLDLEVKACDINSTPIDTTLVGLPEQQLRTTTKITPSENILFSESIEMPQKEKLISDKVIINEVIIIEPINSDSIVPLINPYKTDHNASTLKNAFVESAGATNKDQSELQAHTILIEESQSIDAKEKPGFISSSLHVEDELLETVTGSKNKLKASDLLHTEDAVKLVQKEKSGLLKSTNTLFESIGNKIVCENLTKKLNTEKHVEEKEVVVSKKQIDAADNDVETPSLLREKSHKIVNPCEINAVEIIDKELPSELNLKREAFETKNTQIDKESVEIRHIVSKSSKDIDAFNHGFSSVRENSSTNKKLNELVEKIELSSQPEILQMGNETGISAPDEKKVSKVDHPAVETITPSQIAEGGLQTSSSLLDSNVTESLSAANSKEKVRNVGDSKFLGELNECNTLTEISNLHTKEPNYCYKNDVINTRSVFVEDSKNETHLASSNLPILQTVVDDVAADNFPNEININKQNESENQSSLVDDFKNNIKSKVNKDVDIANLQTTSNNKKENAVEIVDIISSDEEELRSNKKAGIASVETNLLKQNRNYPSESAAIRNQKQSEVISGTNNCEKSNSDEYPKSSLEHSSECINTKSKTSTKNVQPKLTENHLADIKFKSINNDGLCTETSDKATQNFDSQNEIHIKQIHQNMQITKKLYETVAERNTKLKEFAFDCENQTDTVILLTHENNENIECTNSTDLEVAKEAESEKNSRELNKEVSCMLTTKEIHAKRVEIEVPSTIDSKTTVKFPSNREEIPVSNCFNEELLVARESKNTINKIFTNTDNESILEKPKETKTTNQMQKTVEDEAESDTNVVSPSYAQSLVILKSDEQKARITSNEDLVSSSGFHSLDISKSNERESDNTRIAEQLTNKKENIESRISSSCGQSSNKSNSCNKNEIQVHRNNSWETTDLHTDTQIVVAKEINIDGEIVEVVKSIRASHETESNLENTKIKQSTEMNNKAECLLDEIYQLDDPSIKTTLNVNAEVIENETPQSEILISANEFSGINKVVGKEIMPNEIKTTSKDDKSPPGKKLDYQTILEPQSAVQSKTVVQHEDLPTISSTLQEAYDTIPVLPSISTTSPTPSNFSGIFSKKSSSILTTDDDKSKKKSPFASAKRREYILPAASVLCNVDNLENATNCNKKLHWELLDNKNEMTEIEDDADIDTTDDEEIKIEEKPLENASSSSKQSMKPIEQKLSPSETETQTEFESLFSGKTKQTGNCPKIKQSKVSKIKQSKQKLSKTVRVRQKAIGMNNAGTLADDGLLMPKKPVGRPRKNKEISTTNNSKIISNEKNGCKSKHIVENNNLQPEPASSIVVSSKLIGLDGNVHDTISKESDKVKSFEAPNNYIEVEKLPRQTISNKIENNTIIMGGKVKNVPEIFNSMEESMKSLSNSVENLEICDKPCSSKDSIKQGNPFQREVVTCTKKSTNSQYKQESSISDINASVQENHIVKTNIHQENKESCDITKLANQSLVKQVSSEGQRINIISTINCDEACVSSDKADTSVIHNNNVLPTTDIYLHPTRNKVGEENPIVNKSDNEPSTISSPQKQYSRDDNLLKSEFVTKPLNKNKSTTKSNSNSGKYISLQDIGINVRPPKLHLSSYRIPKIKKNAEDIVDNTWKLETYVELDNKNGREQTKQCSEQKPKSMLPEKKHLAEENITANYKKVSKELNNAAKVEEPLNKIKEHETKVPSKQETASGSMNIKNGKRKLFVTDMYDKPTTKVKVETNLSNKPSETSSDQYTVKLRQNLPKTNSNIPNTSSSTKPFKKSVNVHRRILDSSSDEDCNNEEKNNNKKLSSSELNKTCKTAKFENNCEIAGQTQTDAKFSKEQHSAIDSFKIPKNSLLAVSKSQKEISAEVTAKICVQGNLKENSRADKKHDTDLLIKKNENKNIENILSLSKNLKEKNEQPKLVASCKTRRKSLYVERNKEVYESAKPKHIPEEKVVDTVYGKGSKKITPADGFSIVTTERISVKMRRKSICVPTSIDREALNIQDSKNHSVESQDYKIVKNTEYNSQDHKKIVLHEEHLNGHGFTEEIKAKPNNLYINTNDSNSRDLCMVEETKEKLIKTPSKSISLCQSQDSRRVDPDEEGDTVKQDLRKLSNDVIHNADHSKRFKLDKLDSSRILNNKNTNKVEVEQKLEEKHQRNINDKKPQGTCEVPSLEKDNSSLMEAGSSSSKQRTTQPLNHQSILNSSSDDNEPLIKKPTVIPSETDIALTPIEKPKQRRRRVVKVLSTSVDSPANVTTTSQQHKFNQQASPLTSPNHPIFNTEVSTQSTEFAASLPTMPNQQDDNKFKEIDSKLHEIFQSPNYTADYKISSPAAAPNLTITTLSSNDSQPNLTIDETVDSNRENDQSSISQVNEPIMASPNDANNSEIKHLSLGCADYRFEKVSDNVINLFISRKRKRKRNT